MLLFKRVLKVKYEYCYNRRAYCYGSFTYYCRYYKVLFTQLIYYCFHFVFCTILEDIEHCNAISVPQTQWTPLPEAVCAVVLRLSSQGRPAGIETIREALILAFPHVSPPSEQTLYDTLVQLTKERKLYNTSNGYYIVTPE